jgi:hypothetical protein
MCHFSTAISQYAIYDSLRIDVLSPTRRETAAIAAEEHRSSTGEGDTRDRSRKASQKHTASTTVAITTKQQ